MTNYIRSTMLALVSSTVLSSIGGAAFAQDVAPSASKPVAKAPATREARPVEKVADARATMLGATEPTDQERIEVRGVRTLGDGVTGRAFGGGLMGKEDAPKSISAVTRDWIAKQNPAENPMQLIALLPGVNTSDTDPMGMTGGNMSVRGLTESQMGFTLEGFPINDIGNFAVYPQEIVDSENLKTIRLAQGSADLDSPHLSATGGTVDMYMIDPKAKMGGHVNMSYGSFNGTRGFLRFDTGYLGNTNLRAYFSYSQARQDHWRGPGVEDKKHGEMKLVSDWGDGNRWSWAVVGNGMENNAYRAVSLSGWNQYQQYGDKGQSPLNPPANYSAIPYTVSPNGTKTYNSNYYKLHPNPFTNIYSSMPSTFNLGHGVVLTDTPYFWYGYGGGGGGLSTYCLDGNACSANKMSVVGQTVTGSFAGVTSGTYPFYYTSLTQTYRPGNTAKVTLTTGVNRLMIGYWFEYSKQTQTSPYSRVGEDGAPLNSADDTGNLVITSGPYRGETLQYRDSFTQTRVHTPFIGDQLSLLNNRLTIDAGLKYAIVDRSGSNYLPMPSQKYVTTNYRVALPTGAIRYKIDAHNQVFASVSTNFRMPQNYSLYDSGTYNTKTHGYSTVPNPKQAPEISISEEAGWRYQDNLISAAVTYFHYAFTGRLYTQLLPDQVTTTNINAGSSHADGIDVEVGTAPLRYHLRPYASFEYLHAVTDSNMPAGGDYLRTKGKIAPQAPQYQVGFGLDYDDSHAFAGFNLKYVARQYSTFMNDQSIPGYVRMNIHVGYRLPKLGFFQNPEIRLNLQNISDNRYLGYVTSPQGNAVATVGVNGRKIAASSPNYSIASPFAAMATIGSDF
ncbi:MAG: TonB-dependent receptor [Gluconacetobacter sp.]|nr:TonB-dependent receptor [Gluconacetobacter dulcium]